MISKDKIDFYIDTCSRHSQKLERILKVVEPVMPTKADSIESLPSEIDIALDAMRNRYASLQDKIGAKIFPIISSYLIESDNNLSVIDRLNLLERHNYIPSKDWWIELREVRNTISHDYPIDLKSASSQINTIFDKSQELVSFWHNLNPKISQLINQR